MFILVLDRRFGYVLTFAFELEAEAFVLANEKFVAVEGHGVGGEDGGGFVHLAVAGDEPLEIDRREGGEDGGKLMVGDSTVHLVGVEEASSQAGLFQ